jgi:UDP-3-O-[3-hydroxymyristoyl] N-acetylglucosamine deacetylase
MANPFGVLGKVFVSRPAKPRPLAQRTLKSAISCTGTGLHSGRKVAMTLLPAAPNQGIAFRRRGSAALIKADFRNVTDTRLCSLLGTAPGTRFGTVEHLMAAFYGARIDNAIVELDGDEVPVMDGSAAPFLFLIDCAGTIEQAAARRAIEILKPVRVADTADDAILELLPAGGFAATFDIDFAAETIGRQSLNLDLAPETFRQEIARARTFGFEQEVAALRAAGLARGGSLDNAVVIAADGSGLLNPEGLRFDDEFVRHKVLDLVGDLYLAGAPILGAVHARRTGHRHNNAILHALFADASAWRRVDMTEASYLAPAAIPSKRAEAAE